MFNLFGLEISRSSCTIFCLQLSSANDLVYRVVNGLIICVGLYILMCFLGEEGKIILQSFRI